MYLIVMISFPLFQRKVEEVQAQNSSLESENQKLEKNLENFKNASRSVETLEKELYALEPIKDKLDRDNKSLNKQGIYAFQSKGLFQIH